MYYKLLFLVAIFASVALKGVKSISTEQIEKLAKSMRKTCLQKIDTTEDLVEGIQRGEFPDDYNLMCYTNCIMKTLRTFKNGAIDFNMLIKQVDSMMPPDMAAKVKETIRSCRKLEFNGDPCEISYKYVKCYYEADPEAFIFP